MVSIPLRKLVGCGPDKRLPVRVEGALSLQICDGGEEDHFLGRLFDEPILIRAAPDRIKIIPWRVPFKDIALYPDDFFRREAIKPAGVRLCLRTHSQSVVIRGTSIFQPEGKCPRYLMDLCIGGELLATRERSGNTVAFHGLPEGDKEIEIWLSPGYDFIWEGLELEDGGTLLAPSKSSQPRWVVYGSSITHAIRSFSPAQTWPAVVSRKMGWDLLSLGFGGQCMLDPMIARCIRDHPADIITLELGANVYLGEMSPRTFPAAVIGFVATIRERHPNIPLVFSSPIHMANREDTPGPSGLTSKIIRSQIAEITEIFHARGDRNLFHLDGLRLFGPELAGLQPDGVHPDGEGNLRLAENFLRDFFSIVSYT